MQFPQELSSRGSHSFSNTVFAESWGEWVSLPFMGQEKELWLTQQENKILQWVILVREQHKEETALGFECNSNMMPRIRNSHSIQRKTRLWTGYTGWFHLQNIFILLSLIWITVSNYSFCWSVFPGLFSLFLNFFSLCYFKHFPCVILNIKKVNR